MTPWLELAAWQNSIVNTFKTKLTIFSKAPLKADLRLCGESIEQVPSLRYQGMLLNQQSDAKIEVNAGIEQARKTLMNL